MPRPVITGMRVHKTVCNGKATIDVTVNNYGWTTAMGTLKAYVDGNAGNSVGIEVDPYHPETYTLTVPAEPGEHTVKVVLTYPGGSDSMSRTVTLLRDSDCDYLSDQEEYDYGTNPNDPDTDDDGVIDSKDMNPLGDYRIKIYILRARALDDVDSALVGHNPADMNLTLTVNGQTRTLFLTNDQDDKENKILPTDDPLLNLEDYAIAKATFDVPDDKVFIPITFHLYDKEGNKKGEDIDISPGPGTVARIMYNLKTGTWSGDDYPGDEERYFGYGHLSGCGDGSCGVSSHDPEKDLKVYVKYESILEEKGIKGEILNITTIQDVKEVRVRGGKGVLSISRPGSVKIATVRLENGSVVNVTLVNTYNAKVLRVNPIKPPQGPDASLARENTTTVEVVGTAPDEPLKGEVEIIPMEGDLIDPGLGEVVTYSSREEHDGEIWFVIVPDEPDGIPFWREVELNKELEASGISERFDPSDGHTMGYYDPWFAWIVNRRDKFEDYDGDGVPNAVEVLIGKDPAKRDILGIQLNVSVEWKMSEEDKKNLIYSIRKASDFIYDYTDGYAMITKVTIWDDKRNWDKADIQIHNGSCIVGVWNTDICPYTYPIGGYWTEGSITMPKSFKSPLKNLDKILNDPLIRICVLTNFGSGNLVGAVSCLYNALDDIKIGSTDYGRALSHELGHYVFWLGDEYEDWHERIYYLPDWLGTLGGALYGNIVYSQTTAGWFYNNRVPPHSIMDITYEYSELSWPADYERFKAKLVERFGDNWEEHMTYQWGRWQMCDRNTLKKLLNGQIVSSRYLPIENYISPEPYTGPYTGVGYFMGVRLG